MFKVNQDWFCRSIVLLLISGSSSWAATLSIPSGSIYFTNPADAGGYLQLKDGLPAGFFGSEAGVPSDPIPARLLGLTGLPGVLSGSFPHASGLDPTLLFDFSSTDAAFHFFLQHADMTYPQPVSVVAELFNSAATLDNIGDVSQIGFPIFFLDFTDLQPLLVTYGGQNGKSFQYFVYGGLSGGFPMATLTRTSQNGGSIVIQNYPDMMLDVIFQSGAQHFSLPRQTLGFDSANGGFRVVPEPNSLNLITASIIAVVLLHLTCPIRRADLLHRLSVGSRARWRLRSRRA